MQPWLKGLLAAVIGGAATMGSSWMGLAMAGLAGLAVPQLNFKALGIIMLCGSITNLLAYLKQSPIPTDTYTVTKTSSVEVAHEN